MKEQRVLLEQEFKQSLQDIERNFELRKQEILQQNKVEVEREKQKWEQKKIAEEKRLREEAEEAADKQLSQFKLKLRQEEEQEMK